MPPFDLHHMHVVLVHPRVRSPFTPPVSHRQYGDVHPLRLRTSVVVGLVSVVALLTAIAGVAPVSPALACSCVPASDLDSLRAADAVFVGTATGTADPHAGDETFSSADPIVWSFAVSRVRKGSLGATVEIVTARDGASCGIAFFPGQAYVVYAGRAEDRYAGVDPEATLATGLCSGTRPVEPGPAFDRARSDLGAAGARRFRPFPIMWVGERFAGLPLTAIHRGPGTVTFAYGACPIGSSAQGCRLPLQIQTSRMCRIRDGRASTPPLVDRRTVRGVLSGSRGGGLVLLSGRQEIRVFASGGLGGFALDALRAANGGRYPAYGLGRLPAPPPFPARGRIPCAAGG